jgi:hypothetical protein
VLWVRAVENKQVKAMNEIKPTLKELTFNKKKVF